MKYYEDNKNLTNSHRKDLVHKIVQYFIHHRIWVPREHFPKINELIIKEFPTENPVSVKMIVIVVCLLKLIFFV